MSYLALHTNDQTNSRTPRPLGVVYDPHQKNIHLTSMVQDLFESPSGDWGSNYYHDLLRQKGSDNRHLPLGAMACGNHQGPVRTCAPCYAQNGAPCRRN